MVSASGQYRLEPDIAEFFGTSSLRLMAREDRILGRFGRGGFIRGRLQGHVVEARWSERSGHGWIRIRFDDDYRTGECEYGLNEETSPAGSGRLSKILRRQRRPPKR